MIDSMLKPRVTRHQSTLAYPDSIEIPNDSLGQQYVAGHEVGHMVNMGENTNRQSIMGPLYDWNNIPFKYLQVDLDSFLVMPRQ